MYSNGIKKKFMFRYSSPFNFLRVEVPWVHRKGELLRLIQSVEKIKFIKYNLSYMIHSHLSDIIPGFWSAVLILSDF